jgi:WD40 repeat protein
MVTSMIRLLQSIALIVLVVHLIAVPLASQTGQLPSIPPDTEPAAEQAAPEFEEVLLGPAPYISNSLLHHVVNDGRRHVALSDDWQHIAWIADLVDRLQLFLDGKPIGQPYKSLWGTTISPDGKHAACIAREGKHWRVVRDGQAGPPHRDVKQITVHGKLSGGTYKESYEADERPLGPVAVFSPDGSRMAYSARDGGKWRVYVDGQAGPGFDAIGTDMDLGVVFSPDSRHFAYIARKVNKWLVITDCQSGPEYDEILLAIYGPLFSPDSKHIAYKARLGKKRFMVLDGRPSPPYEDIRVGRSSTLAIQFSPDGRRHAYFAESGGKWRIVIDGKASDETFDADPPGTLVFSPDSRHVAYGVRTGSKAFMVIDGIRRPEEFNYLYAEYLAFSPDSSIFAYDAPGSSSDGGVVMANGKSTPAYQGVSIPGLKFSPIGNRLAYAARISIPDKGEYVMVVDGKPGLAFDYLNDVCFSPDGKHFAYSGETYRPQSKWMLVVDGQEHPQLGRVAIIGFSPDSAHVVMTLENKPLGEYALLVDGWSSRKYDDIFGNTSGFVGSIFTCLAIRDHNLYRLSVALP